VSGTLHAVRKPSHNGVPTKVRRTAPIFPPDPWNVHDATLNYIFQNQQCLRVMEQWKCHTITLSFPLFTAVALFFLVCYGYTCNYSYCELNNVILIVYQCYPFTGQVSIISCVLIDLNLCGFYELYSVYFLTIHILV